MRISKLITLIPTIVAEFFVHLSSGFLLHNAVVSIQLRFIKHINSLTLLQNWFVIIAFWIIRSRSRSHTHQLSIQGFDKYCIIGFIQFDFIDINLIILHWIIFSKFIGKIGITKILNYFTLHKIIALFWEVFWAQKWCACIFEL